MIHQKSCLQPDSNPDPAAGKADTLPLMLHCLCVANFVADSIYYGVESAWQRQASVCVKRQASSIEFKRRVSIGSVSVKRRVSVVSAKRQCPCQRRVSLLSPSSEPPLLWPSSPLILLSPSSQRRFSVATGSVDSASTSASSSASARVSVELSQPPLPVLWPSSLLTLLPSHPPLILLSSSTHPPLILH